MNAQAPSAKVVEKKKAPVELRILETISTTPKPICEISSETSIAIEECRRVLDDLMDIGLVIERHDSDAYGHEIIRFRRHCRVISSSQ